jgi:hypothetical protein
LCPLDEVAVNVVDEMIDNLRYSVGKQKTEPKAPDVIEVELPPLDFKPRPFDQEGNWQRRIDCRERQLKAEIAAHQEATNEVYRLSEEQTSVIERAEKAEKERDAALAAKAEIVRAIRAALDVPEDAHVLEFALALKTNCDQLQRDLDASVAEVARMKGERDQALRAMHGLRTELDAARELVKEYREERGALSHAKQCILDITEGDESDDRCRICVRADKLLK